MATVYRQDAADEDLVEHAVCLAIETGQQVADRFLESVEKSFALLATQPRMGAPLAPKDARLAGLRKWAVDGFDNYLISTYRELTELLSCACCTGQAIGGRSSA